LAGSCPILVVAKFADITGEAISDVIMSKIFYAVIRVKLSRKAGFTGGVEVRVGGLVRIVFTGGADGAGGERVVKVGRGRVVGVEAASGA
jgi:hypothetical protein